MVNAARHGQGCQQIIGSSIRSLPLKLSFDRSSKIASQQYGYIGIGRSLSRVELQVASCSEQCRYPEANLTEGNFQLIQTEKAFQGKDSQAVQDHQKAQ